MKILCIIPSRLASTRLPRKPLTQIQGKPMIQWVYERALQCHSLTHTVVATDAKEVADVVTALGGEVIMTDPNIKTGSDRVAAAAQHYSDYDVVVNLQGDEPFIKAEMLTALVAPYHAGENPEMTTLACPLLKDEYPDPNIVKVITNRNHNAIYFSRSPMPYFRQPEHFDLTKTPVYHHQGVYAYRRDFLDTYSQLPQTPLELAETLEQLRAIEHGFKIRVCITPHRIMEINTPEELARAQTFGYETT